MFYSGPLLKNRGRFALIWLAATKGAKLNRRQLCSVNITQVSEDVISVVCQRSMPGVRKTESFSLYLSSQLMKGIVEIQDGQTKVLLEDFKCLFRRMGENDPKEKKPNRRASITLKEDFSNVPFDFGYLGPIPEPSDHVPFEEYFLVPTPQSSKDSNASLEEEDVGRFFDATLDDIELLHTSRREDITMPDVLPDHAEEPIPVTEEEQVDLFAPPLSFFDIPVQHSERGDLGDAVESEPSDQERAQHSVTADASTEIPTVIQRQESIDSSDTFVLPNVIPARRRRRRRHLIIDSATSLPLEQMKKNLTSANTNLTVPLSIPSTLESADSLLKRLGSGLVPKGMNKRFKLLKTRPQPNEFFGLFTPDEEEQEDVSGIDRIYISASEPAEQERAREPEDSKAKSLSGFLKRSTKTVLEASSSVSTKIPDEIPTLSVDPGEVDYEEFLNEPIPEVENLEPLPNYDVPIPEIRVSEIQDEAFQAQKKCRYSPVSPEYTPPPPSPPPTSDILNEALELVKETASLSALPNVTTFGAVIEKTDKTRKRVASLFNSLLFLHAKGNIVLQQPQEEIFIQITENYSP